MSDKQKRNKRLEMLKMKLEVRKKYRRWIWEKII